ncbi:alpha/beta hydrolase [Tsukamurella sp. 8F]|uniref:alpha/beta fold hydrolase n=1 Tax=unclassified Tsukamurella TaxID=2633480 RepID=UPI0023B9C0EF|nr:MULTISPECIES: alpha/beta hydrolase [unclassified Tsukamurella]MDF0532077.1 alpha/beta hydrolase [Tsukamurella sp. 8J]MDF0589189.1 alpha/beta hydrolase [Tsukamurella sp. 8F]
MPTVDLPAGRIHYAETGEGPPVVLLHGLLMNHTVWDEVVAELPAGFRYIRPDLPFGAHPEPMRRDADPSMRGLNRLVADFLEALDLTDVTLVHSDWGGALFLTAYGLDDRLGSMVILPCEAFDNFPPGVPGRVAAASARVPGALALGLRQMRIPMIMRTPFMFGGMTVRPVAPDLVRRWTEPGIRSAAVRRDLLGYLRSPRSRREFVSNTHALSRFHGDALVLWSSAGKVMPREHGRRLADLIPHGRLVELDDAYVLSMLDRPATVATELAAFLTRRRDQTAAGR